MKRNNLDSIQNKIIDLPAFLVVPHAFSRTKRCKSNKCIKLLNETQPYQFLSKWTIALGEHYLL